MLAGFASVEAEEPAMFLAFDGIQRPLSLKGCDELARTISEILHGWPTQRIKPTSSLPAFTITKTKAGYSRQSEWLKKPAVFPNKLNAACDFLVDAFKAYTADNPGLLCLHTAAVDFGDGLYLFPSTYRAGKSTLVTHLASLGLRVYADDVLYITDQDDTGMAPGVLPRLRLPLPDDGGDRFDTFVQTHRGAESPRFLYLKMNETELAPYGETAPIKGIIELNRDMDAEMALSPAKASDILKRTILQNFALEVSALETLDRLHRIVENADCYTLTYACGADAARHLKDTFFMADNRVYTRNPDIEERQVDDEIFLVNPDNEALYNLDILGSAIWRLLENPVSVPEAVDIICKAFPDAEPESVEKDVTELIADLSDHGLIR